ncbi:MAG: transposase, partial [Caldilinea sp.]
RRLGRTDDPRLHPWKPDTLLTRQMRVKVRSLYQLTHQITAATNQLRAVLQRYYSGVLQVFGDLTAQSALTFIQEYPTPEMATQLDREEFHLFLRRQRYPNPHRLVARLAELRNPSLQTTPDTGAIYQEEAVSQAQLLLQMVKSKLQTQRALTALFKTHPDGDIFASLPGTGAFLAPALLVKFGDHRDRFPTAASVQALAGTCPVTDSGGHRHRIYFRQGCDHEFRHYAQQWARASTERNRSQFADGYWHDALDRGLSKHHAYRCLANRWLAIAWRLWQNRSVYDETYHLQQRLRRFRPNSLT